MVIFPLLVYSAGDIACEQHTGPEIKYKMKFNDFENHLLVDIANVISHLKWNGDIRSVKLWEVLQN